jgi:hypothetical protein
VSASPAKLHGGHERERVRASSANPLVHTRNYRRIVRLVGLLLAATAPICAAQVKHPFVTVDDQGALVYHVDARGNRIPDFSSAGYGGGGVTLPEVPTRVVVYPEDGDDGARIQAAIEQVAALPPDVNGLRGAVYLPAGRYEIAGQVRITASGVVLRGAGSGEDGTVFVATGRSRRTLIEIAGRHDLTRHRSAHPVSDAYVPVGASELPVRGAADLPAGSRVIVEWRAMPAWIEALGLHEAPARTPYRWRAEDVVLTWDRRIMARKGDRITLDAPLTTALEAAYGEASVSAYTWPGRISNVGVEHLRCVSEFQHPLDEEHAWMAIALDAVEDAWVSDVVAVHFVSSAVHVGEGARAVTVQDCTSLAPVSELGGYRRHAFHTSGQLTLFQRCRSGQGRNDFTVGYFAGGPNVFLDCEAVHNHGRSGSLGSWASGALFDNATIDGGELALDNLETWNGGVGWALANSVVWQSSASVMTVRRPPTANNWAVGVWGQFVGNGWWDQVDEFVQPESLYRAQLARRLGEGAVANLAKREPKRLNEAELHSLTLVATPQAATSPVAASASEWSGERSLVLTNGWLVDASDGALLIGKELPLTWWRGSMMPTRAGDVGPSLTRFAPGRSGPGATDDLEALARAMIARNEVLVRHHYGLWYDRRRDDHQRMRRASADVWPPFYEQPWARSGVGQAADGLSLYDLTRYNPWYFGRLLEFARQARRQGLVLVNEMYFQHNILESGAHWVDSPWRPVNALQDTGFPEPPPFTGDTIKVADWFYDVSHPVRRELHRAYIRQCLANLADQPNVVHTTSGEFSGPLHFVQFWLEVIAEWQAETGRDPLIALSAPKDVQDAILADPKLQPLVDAIDFTYWWRTDTDVYAPRGGENLAPRQHLRKWKGGRATAASLAAMVAEYRERFPDKAVMTGLAQPDPWVFVAAGGSFPALPASTDRRLLVALAHLRPAASARARQWTLARADEWFAAALGGEPLVLDLTHASGEFRVHRIDPRTGAVERSEPSRGGRRLEIASGATGPTVVWITR